MARRLALWAELSNDTRSMFVASGEWEQIVMRHGRLMTGGNDRWPECDGALLCGAEEAHALSDALQSEGSWACLGSLMVDVDFGRKENKTFFTPGPGLGGHCIPIDPFYLTWKAREHEIATRFIELAGEINTSMPDYVIRQLTIALNERRQPVRGAKILVLGLAYKPDVDDLRESPSITIIEKLRRLGADVAYNDPYIPHTRQQREHDLRMQSVELTPQALADQDAVLIVTNHSCYDYAWIVANARLVIDTRNATVAVTEGREKILKA